MNLGESLRIILNRTGMMKKHLAKELGVTPQTISHLMGDRYWTRGMIEEICSIFDLTASEFVRLGEKGEQNGRG